MVKDKRILVVYKNISSPDARHKMLFHQKKREQAHHETLNVVKRTLAAMQLPHAFISRSGISSSLRADLIITVGGDGTVIAASHIAHKTPVLGVNSVPAFSTGFYCAATKENFASWLTAIIKKKVSPLALPRLCGKINNKPLEYPALNDILIAGLSPADTIYYRVKVGKKSEVQRSSGMWIAAGPGSTAGFHSAGGMKAPMTSNIIRYLVREPCPLPNHRYTMLRGKIGKNEKMKITCEGTNVMLYLDGTALVHELTYQQTLTVEIEPTPFFLFFGKQG